MDVRSRAADIGMERALFAVGAVVTGALTVLVIRAGAEPIERFMYFSFTMYLLGAAIPAVRARVPEYKRSGAVALGAIGAVAFFSGSSSALSLLFVVGGIAAFLRIF